MDRCSSAAISAALRGRSVADGSSAACWWKSPEEEEGRLEWTIMLSDEVVEFGEGRMGGGAEGVDVDADEGLPKVADAVWFVWGTGPEDAVHWLLAAEGPSPRSIVANSSA